MALIELQIFSLSLFGNKVIYFHWMFWEQRHHAYLSTQSHIVSWFMWYIQE